MSSTRGVPWKWILASIVLVVLVGGGSGAAVCRFTDAACGINPWGDVAPPESLEDFGGLGRGEMTLEDGLQATTVVSGLRFPTDLDFLPDGRVLVAEKDGLIRVVEGGTIRERPFLDLRSRVNTFFFRGVVDVTLDPGYPDRPFVYVVYAMRGTAGRASARPTWVRVSRFTIRGGVALPDSERVLVGENGNRACLSRLRGEDCLHAVGTHIGADIAFAPDGTLYVSTGDGAGEAERVERASFAAQDPDSLNGKVLHIDRQGRGVPGNPFWTGDPNANRSKVWATGFRNPFRIELVPGPRARLVVADVGWDAYEELNVVERGSDYGWPCYEGPERTPKYGEHRFCASYYANGASPVQPWLAVRQVRQLSITGGVHMGQAEGWPPTFANQYLFADWATSEIYALPATFERPASEPRTVATNAAGPVALALREDGLYFLALNAGELRRIAPG